MTLQFITGAGSCDHEKTYLHVADDWLKKTSHEVFFIVPNYNKFEREQEILAALKRSSGLAEFSTIRSQVYSFNRLAWYFLQSTGLISDQNISAVGSAMVMRRVLEKLQDQLLLFKGEINKAGFIEKLLELYQEFQLGNVDLNSLDLAFSASNAKEADLQLKMKEIRLIFTHFEAELMERNVQVEQPVAMLAQYLETEDGRVSQQLKEKLFVVVGFSSFSMQELQLLNILLQKSHLCIDLYIENTQLNKHPFDLFQEAKETYFSLKNMAGSQKVRVLEDHKAPLLETVDPAYLELERLFRQTSSGAYTQEKGLDPFVQLWSAENPEEELRQIAAEIRHLVADSSANGKPLYYRDIQLLTLDPATYYPLIPTVFEELDIPLYLDEDRKMEEHPLVEFIQSLFAMDTYHYRCSDVFRFLRTELYIPDCAKKDRTDWIECCDHFREIVDLTENEALANDFRGADWTRQQDWKLLKFGVEEKTITALEELTNGLRNDFRRDIVLFFDQLKKASVTKDALLLFYQFLEDIGVEKQLLFWRDQEIHWGNLDQSRNHEQTWAALMDLLDEYMQIYGAEPFDFSLFKQILSSGLENLAFGKIPTAIDQVQVNPLDLARPLQAKVTFAVGLDNMSFPRTVENKSLISTEERQTLNQYLNDGQFLRDKAAQTVQNEPFVAYNMLLSASEKLYLTYARNMDSKQNLPMSNYLQRLLTWSDLKCQERSHLTLHSAAEKYVGTYRSLIRQLNSLARQAENEKKSLPPVWRSLKGRLLRSSQGELAVKVFSSQTYQNVPVQLNTDLAQKLYGKDLYSSISRMESFYDCQYQYFSRFGLRLQERKNAGLDAAIIGEFFHQALDQFMKTLISENLSLTAMNETQLQTFVDEVLKNIFGDERYAFMDRSARMNFIRYQLKKTVSRVSWGLKKQAEKTQLTPVQTEVLFGQVAGNIGIPGLDLPLSTGGSLYLRGKIDRIDTAVVEGKTWLSVVDYKSSPHSFDLTESYYGLAMQLLSYLDVALKDALQLVGQKEVQGAGAYYFHVYDPLLKPQDNSEKKRLQNYKFDGIFADDTAVFAAFDDSLSAQQTSAVFPIRKDKSDLWKKTSANKFYSRAEIGQLIRHNRRKLQEAGEKIVTGSVELNPSYKLKDQRRACQFCPFRSVCTFDPMLTENNYHRIRSLSKEDLMQRIEEEENE